MRDRSLSRGPWVLALLVAALWAAPSAAAQESAVRTVNAVDLERYLGDWFEIARLPNNFQDDCLSDVKARYSRRDDGRLNVRNSCRRGDGNIKDAEGVARVVDERTNSKLKVRFAPAFLTFLPWVWGDYWIIGLADDYSWAVVGSPDRKYLWILARSPQLDDASYAAAIRSARENGFPIERLVRTRHTAE
jgi:apolipoprotein D and lipocalin family protein